MVPSPPLPPGRKAMPPVPPVDAPSSGAMAPSGSTAPSGTVPSSWMLSWFPALASGRRASSAVLSSVRASEAPSPLPSREDCFSWSGKMIWFCRSTLEKAKAGWNV